MIIIIQNVQNIQMVKVTTRMLKIPKTQNIYQMQYDRVNFDARLINVKPEYEEENFPYESMVIDYSVVGADRFR